MASISVLGDSGAKKPQRVLSNGCKCSYNPRAKRWVQVCFVGKSKQFRSGWRLKKDESGDCTR